MLRSGIIQRICCFCYQQCKSAQRRGIINLNARQYHQSPVLQPRRLLPQSHSLHRLPFNGQKLTHVASLHYAAFSKQQFGVCQKQSCLQERICMVPMVHSTSFFQQFRGESTGLETNPPPSDLIYIPTPVELTYEFLEYFHDEVSISWWMAIVATTVIYKSLLSFPLAVLQQRVFARIENVQPEINTYVEQAKQQLALIAKERNWSKAEHQTQFDREVKGIVWAIHTKKHCAPFRLGYVFLAQAGIWVSVTMALGQMTGWYPKLFSAEPDIDVLTSLSTGGTLWFTDLMQGDFILPVFVGLINLTLVEVWSLRRGPLTRMQNRFHNLARVLAISSMPLAASMPSTTYLPNGMLPGLRLFYIVLQGAKSVTTAAVYAISFYWLISSLFSLTQFALLRNLWIRRTLGIPKSTSEMKHPLTEIKTGLRIKYKGKKVF